MTISGYKYLTESSAIDARTSCDSYHNLPLGNNVTTHWCDYDYSELDGFWYITYHESLSPILGEPIDITITLPTPPTSGTTL